MGCVRGRAVDDWMGEWRRELPGCAELTSLAGVRFGALDSGGKGTLTAWSRTQEHYEITKVGSLATLALLELMVVRTETGAGQVQRGV